MGLVTGPVRERGAAVSGATAGAASAGRAAGAAAPPGPDLVRLAAVDARRTGMPVRQRVRPRGVPPALAGHPVLVAADAPDLVQLLARVTAASPGSVRATALDAEAAGDGELHGLALGAVSVHHVAVSVGAVVAVARTGPRYSVLLPADGTVVARVQETTAEVSPVAALVTNPGDALHLELRRGSALLVVGVDQAALVRHAAHRGGGAGGSGAPPRLAPLLDLTGDAGVRWLEVVQLLLAEAARGGGGATEPLEDFAMSTLLLAQPDGGRPRVHGLPGRPGRRTVRRAVAYLDEHLDEPVTLADLCAHAGASARTVQQGFRDELGVTPSGYQRLRRLEGVRGDLLAARPGDGTTVTAVAERWGFHHLGGFSALYRRCWGESPSQTLRR